MNLKKITFLITIIFPFSFFLFPFFSAAQTSGPQFMVSWKAGKSYSPAWYKGKVFPTTGSVVNVKFDLIDNGKSADLSKTTVRWYINDDLKINERNGLGIKSYSYIVNDYIGNDIEVRISIPDYKGGVLNNVINIPVVKSEISINAPFFDKKINPGRLNLEAIPLFFNVSDLSDILFKWVANGQAAEETNNPSLNLDIDSGAAKGSDVDLSVFARNSDNKTETANKSLKLEIN